MLRQSRIDDVFTALGDPTRRAMLEQLSNGPASVSALAEPLRISLAAVVQHLDVLGDANLITSEKVGRVRLCRLNTVGLRAAEKWLSDRRHLVDATTDRISALLDEDLAPPKKRRKS
ncbi:MAG: ArsR/SmtB family transcription factor [Archangium sp.]